MLNKITKSIILIISTILILILIIVTRELVFILILIVLFLIFIKKDKGEDIHGEIQKQDKNM